MIFFERISSFSNLCFDLANQANWLFSTSSTFCCQLKIIMKLTNIPFSFADAILGELCALESHFPSSSNTSTASSTASSNCTVLQKVVSKPKMPNQADTNQQDDLVAPVPAPPPPLMMSSQENIQKYLCSSSSAASSTVSAPAEPQYITAESVRQNKQNQQKRTESPDNDSAFCDNTSSNSGNSDDQLSSQATGGVSKKTENCKNQLNLKLNLKSNSIGNVQLYFTFRQFCTLGDVVEVDQNICHLKVTPVSPFLNICDLSVTHM